MLINLKEMMALAESKNYAVGSFNTPNLESIMAILQSAEQLQVPVVLNHAEVHEEVMPLHIIGPIMVDMAKKSTVPVCVHLDHGLTIDYIKQALEIGFSSVMYDGSILSYEENVTNTKTVVDMAKKYNASVEAELGIIGGREDGDGVGEAENQYTDPDLALKFAIETNIDALACSFGTAHGFYKTTPKLDFDRIRKIRDLTGLPLVMHGGSGVSSEDYEKAIGHGIRKINYYSYMALAGTKGVKDLLATADVFYYHDIVTTAVKVMAENAIEAMGVFYQLKSYKTPTVENQKG